jgi:hypothetical protein
LPSPIMIASLLAETLGLRQRPSAQFLLANSFVALLARNVARHCAITFGPSGSLSPSACIRVIYVLINRLLKTLFLQRCACVC